METPDIETSGTDYATRFAGDVGRYFLEIQEKSVIGLLKTVAGRTVLDVGGAHGQVAVPLRNAGYDVTIYGSSEQCRKNLSERLGREGDFPFVSGDLLNLPFPDRSFDLAVSFRLLPHLERWDVLIRELARVARVGVLVDYPTIASVNLLTPLLFRLKKKIEKNTRPYTLFTTGKVRDAFSRSGYRLHGRRGQFLLPMALHRWTGPNRILERAESGARKCGITDRIGSPIVLLAVREELRLPEGSG